MIKVTYIPPGRTGYNFNASGREMQNITGLTDNPITPLTTKIYEQDGEVYLGTNQSPRTISIDWVVRGDIIAETEILMAALNPGLGLGTLVLENASKKYKIGAAVALKPVYDKLVYNQVKIGYNVVFICPKPDFLDYTPTTIKMVDFAGGLEYPKTYPIMYAQRGDGATINYQGHNPADVALDLRGPAVNPVIENVTTGLTIETKNLTLLDGEKLLIDTNPDAPSVQMVTGGVTTDAWNKIKYGSKFWMLRYGNNKINFSADSGTPECYLTYSAHYAGIILGGQA
jgi:hypothetical protein